MRKALRRAIETLSATDEGSVALPPPLTATIGFTASTKPCRSSSDAHHQPRAPRASILAKLIKANGIGRSWAAGRSCQRDPAGAKYGHSEKSRDENSLAKGCIGFPPRKQCSATKAGQMHRIRLKNRSGGNVKRRNQKRPTAKRKRLGAWAGRGFPSGGRPVGWSRKPADQLCNVGLNGVVSALDKHVGQKYSIDTIIRDGRNNREMKNMKTVWNMVNAGSIGADRQRERIGWSATSGACHFCSRDAQAQGRETASRTHPGRRQPQADNPHDQRHRHDHH